MLLISRIDTMPKLLHKLLALTPARRHKEVQAPEHSEQLPSKIVETKGTIQPDTKLQRYQYGTRSYRLNHIAPERLEHIIHQVHTEDYHVEYLSSFAWKESQPVEVMAAVIRWAKRSGLKVSINYERGICFFESS
jgi:hypothetical protein